MSIPSNAQFSHNLVPSFLSNISILLSIHLLHFLAHILGPSVQLILFLLCSAAVCWYLPPLDVHIEPEKTRKIRLFILFLLASSLSKAFLVFLYESEETSHEHTTIIDIILSTLLSTLMITCFIRLKFFFTAHEESITQKVKKLISERDEAQRSSEEYKFLMAVLTHDSRNILNCLINSLKFLETSLSPVKTSSANIQEDLLCAKYCSNALLTFFNSCLESQKTCGSKLPATKLDLPEIMEKVQGIIRSAIQFKKLEMNLTIEENTPTNVFMNESCLIQIMLNLIYNAIKFTDKGSINVKIGWKNLDGQAKKVKKNPLSTMRRNSSFKRSGSLKRTDSNREISLSQTEIDTLEGKLLIEVTDTGCGIPEDALNKLFKPFSQVTSDSNKRKQGTGLGLWLTKMLVEKIRGQTKVTSKVGKGSTFTVVVECQAVPEQGMRSPRRELYIESVNKTVDEKASRKNGVLLGGSPIENLCIKGYMRTLGIDVIEEVTSLRDLLNYLRINSNDGLVIVTDENHLDGLNSLNKWNMKLLDNKKVVIVEDKRQDCQTHCEIQGSQCVERPVRWNDFLKAVSGITAQGTRLGSSF